MGNSARRIQGKTFSAHVMLIFKDRIERLMKLTGINGIVTTGTTFHLPLFLNFLPINHPLQMFKVGVVSF